MTASVKLTTMTLNLNDLHGWQDNRTILIRIELIQQSTSLIYKLYSAEMYKF